MLAFTNLLNHFANAFQSSARGGVSHCPIVSAVVPRVSHEKHKGCNGRVCVVGGSAEYTGAPYYAAASSLKTGADLAFVICHPDAAVAVKSYSPELIVYPSLGDQFSSQFEQLIDGRVGVLVLGPGLGRSDEASRHFYTALDLAQSRRLPMVIDADGLYFIAQRPRSINGRSLTVLTPNVVEFQRLRRAVLGANSSDDVKRLAQAMGNVTIVLKGRHDIITDGATELLCNRANSARRCGGQGDLLSGSLATFLHSVAGESFSPDQGELSTHNKSMLAAYAACALTRECNRLAFDQLSISATTVDMLRMLPGALSNLTKSNGCT